MVDSYWRFGITYLSHLQKSSSARLLATLRCVKSHNSADLIYTAEEAWNHTAYRVINKSLRDFRPLRYSSLDGHAEGEHVLPHTCNVFGRDLITALTSAASPNVDISSTCKVGQRLPSVSPSVDMPPFGLTIPVTVSQRSEIPEGLMNYPVYFHFNISLWWNLNWQLSFLTSALDAGEH